MEEQEGIHYRLEEEKLTGLARLAQEAAENRWKQPRSGQIAAVEFEGWARQHSPEEVDQLIGHVREFAAAIGVPWDEINQRPEGIAEQKKREAISCFAISIWRMRQLKDVHPRFLQAIDKVAELEGPQFDEARVRELSRQMRQALDEVLTLPQAGAEAEVTTTAEAIGDAPHEQEKEKTE